MAHATLIGSDRGLFIRPQRNSRVLAFSREIQSIVVTTDSRIVYHEYYTYHEIRSDIACKMAKNNGSYPFRKKKERKKDDDLYQKTYSSALL